MRDFTVALTLPVLRLKCKFSSLSIAHLFNVSSKNLILHHLENITKSGRFALFSAPVCLKIKSKQVSIPYRTEKRHVLSYWRRRSARPVFRNFLRLRAVSHFSQGYSSGRARERARKSPRTWRTAARKKKCISRHRASRVLEVIFARARVLSMHSTIPEKNEGLLVF